MYWDQSEINWASRWDAYLKMPGGRVHWFSILNSLMVVLVMSSIVAMIMMRTIRRDLQRYEGLLGEPGGLLSGTAPGASLCCCTHSSAGGFCLSAVLWRVRHQGLDRSWHGAQRDGSNVVACPSAILQLRGTRDPVLDGHHCSCIALH